MASSETWTPSVDAAAVNECPAPMALTLAPAVAARRTIPATSSVDRGVTRSATSHRSLPAQLEAVVVTDRIVRVPPSPSVGP